MQLIKRLFIFLRNALRVIFYTLIFIGCIIAIGSTFGYLNVLYFTIFSIVSVFIILKNFGSRKRRANEIIYNSKEFLSVSLLSIILAIGLYSTYELWMQGYRSSFLIIGMLLIFVFLPGWAIVNFLRNSSDCVRLTNTTIEIKDNDKVISIELITIKSCKVNSDLIITLMDDKEYQFDLFELNLNARDGENIKRDLDKLRNKEKVFS